MMSTRVKKATFRLIIFLSAIYILSSLYLIIGEALQESEVIVPPTASPYESSIAEWSVKWWQWALSIDSDKNPINDKTGIYCDTNQNNRYAWFLAGSGGGQVERTCTIPLIKPSFFP